MKRRVLCVFSLIGYLLAVCLLLCGFVEDQMTIPVTVQKLKSSTQTGTVTSVPIQYAFDGGNPYDLRYFYLAEAAEGSGWLTGLRCFTFQNYTTVYETQRMEFYSDREYSIITGAARDPFNGQMVKIVEPQVVEDRILFTFPADHDIPELSGLPSHLTVLAKSDHSVLLKTENGTSPFFSNAARNWHDDLAVSVHAFSLTEAEAFLMQLPMVMLAALAILSGILFWFWGCAARCEEGTYRVVIASCIGVGISLLLLAVVLAHIHLPASMLPCSNILELSHYKKIFTEIFGAIRNIELPGQNLVHTMQQVKLKCGLAVLGFFLVEAGAFLALFCRIRHKTRTGNRNLSDKKAQGV